MSFLDLQGLQKSFNAAPVVRDFSLQVARGEFLSFLGPSGCGKTTVLRIIAGFESPSAGVLRIGGADVTALPAAKRRIGMVFQNYALFPNMTVAQNVGFGLKVAGMGAREIKARTEEMLALIALPHLGERYPYQLSGGQQQRVALARALAPKPDVLLLDEPLSALDAQIRVSLREDIRKIQRETGITTVFVTHDQEEALSISDRVVVMYQGRAEQIGTPSEIYNRPASRFVAGFVGHLNRFEARVAGAGLVLGGTVLPIATDLPQGAEVLAALRPEALALAPATPRHLSLSGTVLETSFLGAVIRLALEVSGARISVDLFNQSGLTLPRIGAELRVYFSPDDLLILPK